MFSPAIKRIYITNRRTVLLLLITAALVFICVPSKAHRYFFALTELTINPKNKQLEVIHYLTSHDLELLISNKQNINLTPEHPNYQQYIEIYLAEHFQISYKNHIIKLKTLGIERVSDKLFIYQENINQNFLTGLVVKNDLLVDTYANQINTVNYQDTAKKGSLTFDKVHRVLEIN